MIEYVAFLRGINVGGKNKIKMETLRELFAAQGFSDVKTYINSGNVIFKTSETNEDILVTKIETGIENKFSLKIKVMLRRIEELADIIKNNPFAGQFDDDKNLHVFFLDAPVPNEKRILLLSNNNENEQFAVCGREIFCLLRRSVLNSLMGKDYIGKKLKLNATARNWRTVNKILEMSRN